PEAALLLPPPTAAQLADATLTALHLPPVQALPEPQMQPIAPAVAVRPFATPHAGIPEIVVRPDPVIPVGISPLISKATLELARRLAGGDNHVEAMALYDDRMRAALLMPDYTPAQLSARTSALVEARHALVGAFPQQSLTPDTVARIDGELGLPAS